MNEKKITAYRFLVIGISRYSRPTLLGTGVRGLTRGVATVFPGGAFSGQTQE